MAETKRLNVSVSCMATYNSHIDVPADMSLKKAVEYANEHIGSLQIETDLEYVSDSDIINEESCHFDEC